MAAARKLPDRALKVKTPPTGVKPAHNGLERLNNRLEACAGAGFIRAVN
jgi:hypothetical protein